MVDAGKAYNQLDGISKGCIHQTAYCLTQLGTEFFSGKTKERGERDDGEEVDDEYDSWVEIQGTENDADRDEDQKSTLR